MSIFPRHTITCICLWQKIQLKILGSLTDKKIDQIKHIGLSISLLSLIFHFSGKKIHKQVSCYSRGLQELKSDDMSHALFLAFNQLTQVGQVRSGNNHFRFTKTRILFVLFRGCELSSDLEYTVNWNRQCHTIADHTKISNLEIGKRDHFSWVNRMPR